MANAQCRRNYHRMKILNLEVFSAGVKTGFYGNNPPFTAPPFPESQFESFIDEYNRTYTDFKNGGRLLKAKFQIAKTNLLAALDKLAEIVNEVAAGDETIIEKSGFKPSKSVRSAAVVLHAPHIELLERGVAGELIVSCNMLGDHVTYGCLLTEGAAIEGLRMEDGRLVIPQGSVTVYLDENTKRKKHFRGLKPTITYYVYFFARNRAGVSLLSVPRSIMCA